MPRKEGKTNKQTLSKAAKLVRLFYLFYALSQIMEKIIYKIALRFLGEYSEI